MRILPTGKTSLGFTLLELLVVMAMIGFLAALAMPLYSKSEARLQMWSASHALLLDLRRAHSEAKADKRTVSIAFFPEQNSYILGDQKHQLAVELASLSYEGASQQLPSETPVVSFYADGSAMPASIILSKNDYRTHIHIDGLTGRVDSDAN